MGNKGEYVRSIKLTDPIDLLYILCRPNFYALMVLREEDRPIPKIPKGLTGGADLIHLPRRLRERIRKGRSSISQRVRHALASSSEPPPKKASPRRKATSSSPSSPLAISPGHTSKSSSILTSPSNSPRAKTPNGFARAPQSTPTKASSPLIRAASPLGELSYPPRRSTHLKMKFLRIDSNSMPEALPPPISPDRIPNASPASPGSAPFDFEVYSSSSDNSLTILNTTIVERHRQKRAMKAKARDAANRRDANRKVLEHKANRKRSPSITFPFLSSLGSDRVRRTLSISKSMAQTFKSKSSELHIYIILIC